MSEADFQKQVLWLAVRAGWVWMHVRQSRAKRGYGNATSGPMGKGWPDLVLVRGDRMLFFELKTETGKLSEEQVKVHGWLAATGNPVNVARPADLEAIQLVLR